MGGDSHSSFIGIFAGELCCTAAFDCNQAFDKYGGIVLWVLIMLYMFKALGTICDEYFVPSLEVIVEKLQLSNDVAGATFMAAGSSAPEFFTSMVATFLIVNEGGVGTIVGSAIFNILVICGATGVIACKEQSLKIWWYPLCRDSFFYSISILELMVFVSNEYIEWYEGLAMFFTYCCYCVYMKFNPNIVKMLGIIDPSLSEVTAIDETSVKVVEVTTVEDAPTKLVEAATPMQEDAVLTTTNGSGAVPEQTALRTLASGEAAKEEVRQPDVRGPGTVNTPEEVDATSVEALPQSPEKPRESLLVVKGLKSSDSATLLDPSGGAPQGERRRPSWSYNQTKDDDPEKRKPSKDGATVLQVTDGGDERPPPLAVAADETGSSEQVKKGWIRDPLIVLWEVTMPGPERLGGGLLFGLSIFFIGMCTYMMVDATNRVGVVLHIPPLAMALVFLAAGTSIPDALGSIAVAKQGEGDMAVANALGSNVFDILVGLGVPWFIKTGMMGKEVHFEGKWDELVWDFGALCIVLCLFIGCLATHGWRLTRRVGFLLIAMYFMFLIWQACAIWLIDPPLKKPIEQDFCDTI